MKRTTTFLTLFLLLALIAAGTSSAGLVNYNRRNRNAGAAPQTVTESSVKTYKGTGGQAVKSLTDKKFDVNRNDTLEPSEIRAMLNSIVREVGSKGEARVESDAVRVYDRNGDGVISTTELSKILQDLDK